MNDFLDDGEADPGSVGLDLFEAMERSENDLVIFWIDADSVVSDVDIDFRIINGYELPRPWQIGGLQAGPQQPLGALNPFDGAA